MQPAGVLRGVNPSEVEQPTRFEIRTFLLHMSVRGTSPMYEMATVFVSSRGSVDILREIQRLNGKPIFRLTRVTRIFEKSVFTETTPEARAACRAGFFVARTRARPRPAGLRVFAKKQGNTGDHSHAVSKRRKRESVRTAARGAQSGNRPSAGIVGRARREHRCKAHRTRGGRRHAGHSRVHGAAYAGDQAPADRRGAAADRDGG